ncbi:MAG: hypothetical protein RR415_12875 [Ruthenibacterium sp.]
MDNKPYGFIAFWKSSDLWYDFVGEAREDYFKKIKEIQEEAKSSGVIMYGNFDCSWSCEWRYFTFWTCPDVKILEDIIAKLEAIGDVNRFNIQRHYIGHMI